MATLDLTALGESLLKRVKETQVVSYEFQLALFFIQPFFYLLLTINTLPTILCDFCLFPFAKRRKGESYWTMFLTNTNYPNVLDHKYFNLDILFPEAPRGVVGKSSSSNQAWAGFGGGKRLGFESH